MTTCRSYTRAGYQCRRPAVESSRHSLYCAQHAAVWERISDAAANGAPAERSCLQCGETPTSIYRQGIVLCGIVGGYEYRELEVEWPRHRWADWTDGELARLGVVQAAYDRHRRTPAMHFEWIAFEDTLHGHSWVETEEEAEFWELEIGRCAGCGARR